MLTSICGRVLSDLLQLSSVLDLRYVVLSLPIVVKPAEPSVSLRLSPLDHSIKGSSAERSSLYTLVMNELSKDAQTASAYKICAMATLQRYRDKSTNDVVAPGVAIALYKALYGCCARYAALRWLLKIRFSRPNIP